MTDHVEVYRDLRDEWRWRRQSENGRIVATSGEGYINLDHALKMAEQLNGDLPTQVITSEIDKIVDPPRDE